MKVLIFRGDVVKAYQIKIQLEGLDVWRRVVMPAEVPFNALHSVIQYSMGSLPFSNKMSRPLVGYGMV